MTITDNNIDFNKAFITGSETKYINEVLKSRKFSGDGFFTKQCCKFFEDKYHFKKSLLTTSCTDALEMAAILIDTEPGDEIIAPSYTFVSTVNAFVLRGAKIVFADSYRDNPNIDADGIEKLITPKTKAILAVHYAGVACDMQKLMELSKKYNLFLIEDAAQAIDSFYNGKPLGSFGHLSAFSFHETKNIQCGEGGLLVINDNSFYQRAEIIREKGTNRSAFFRGEVDKYGWVDLGSSFLPSDILAAFLFAQIEALDYIQNKRKELWAVYNNILAPHASAGKFELTNIPESATSNAHMFYLVCKNLNERKLLIDYLKKFGIKTSFHYLSLHSSKFYKDKYYGEDLINSNKYTDCLLRLPLYPDLTTDQVKYIGSKVIEYFNDVRP